MLRQRQPEPAPIEDGERYHDHGQQQHAQPQAAHIVGAVVAGLVGRLIAPFGFTPTGKSYCVLHAKQAAGNAKIEAFRSWIVSVAQRTRLDVPRRELRERAQSTRASRSVAC